MFKTTFCSFAHRRATDGPQTAQSLAVFTPPPLVWKQLHRQRLTDLVVEAVAVPELCWVEGKLQSRGDGAQTAVHQM